MRRSETIAAIATAPGEGGIAIVRVSGSESIRIVDQYFKGKSRLSEARGYTIQHGVFCGSDKLFIDEVLALVFRSPNSYTTEDTIEICCHGGALISQKICDALIFGGALPALPGEFTMRAFLGGRIDLTQAEAVCDLIKAKSDAAAQIASSHLRGGLLEEIKRLRMGLLDCISNLEISLDFSEEDLELDEDSEIIRALKSIYSTIKRLTASYSIAKRIQIGIRVVITGRTNAGKSSLLNSIIQRNRAIVSDEPGTTRDYIDENVLLNGIQYDIYDTAGLRESFNPIEAEGINRTWNLISTADLVLYVVDPSNPTQDDLENLKRIREIFDGTVLTVVNKIDLFSETQISALCQLFPNDAIPISTKFLLGLDELKRRIDLSTWSGRKIYDGVDIVLTQERQVDCMMKSLLFINRAIDMIKADKGKELVVFELRLAIRFLEEVVGFISDDDVLENIFSKFCIGK